MSEARHPSAGGSGHQALIQELEVPHLGFDATLSVRPAPVLPDCPTEAPACSQGILAGLRCWCGRLPEASVAAGRDHGLGLAEALAE